MPKTDHSFNPEGYATVAERITLFHERHPAGRIQTELVSRDGGEIIFKAMVYRDLADAAPAATGWASERVGDGEINTVACLENTETSAIGRALANLGFTASARRPSREEMEKAERARRRQAIRRSPDLQAQADAAHDLLDLLSSAERRGLPRKRATIVRERAQRMPALPLGRVRKLERGIRAWLRRREA